MIAMDTQLVEIIGRQRLIFDLLTAGLEVALPIRDRGIDLIAYADRREQVARFTACPIQMKAAQGASFSIDRKYAQFPNLLVAYVWHVSDPRDIEIFALTHEESVAVAETMGYTRTASWRSGMYMTSRPSKELVSRLAPFRMDPDRWRSKVLQLQVAK
jgi:hypothetical protein